MKKIDNKLIDNKGNLIIVVSLIMLIGLIPAFHKENTIIWIWIRLFARSLAY